MRAAAVRRQGKGHDAFERIGRIVIGEVPRIGEALMWLDGKHLAVENAAPFALELEFVTELGREIIVHQPFADEMRLGQRPPYLFRRMGKLALDSYGAQVIHGFSPCLARWRRGSAR